jgi:hypothetical protein
MKDFHCCATCENFRVVKENKKISYSCSRLGFDTKPNYKFNCWVPKEQVKKLINKKD